MLREIKPVGMMIIVNASAGPADPAFEGHNGCRRSVLGQHRKSLKMKSRGLPKSSQMRPGRLQNRFQDLSEVAPGPLPGALGALRRQKCV